MNAAMDETRRGKGLLTRRVGDAPHAAAARARGRRHPTLLLAAALFASLIPAEASADDTPTPTVTATSTPTATPTPTPTPITDYYVSAGTGNDSTGDGTQSAPWASIAKALDSIGGGGTAEFPVTIRIAGGTYYETGLDYSSKLDYASLYGGYDPASWARDITLYPAVIDGSKGADGSNGIKTWDYCTLDGLTFQDFKSYAVICVDSSPVITRCRFLRSGDSAIWAGENTVIRRNVFIGNHDCGVLVYSKEGFSTTVENNLILSSAGSGQAAGVTARGNARIVNNTIAKCGRGIEVRAYSEDSTRVVLIQNNILADNIAIPEDRYVHYGIYVQNTVDPSTVIIRHNNLWNNGYQYGGVAEPGEGDCAEEPDFVDAGGEDYHLREGSPCIDRGAAGGPADDLDGNPRPTGSGADLGCYEYLGGNPSPGFGSLAVLLTADRFRAGDTLDVYVQIWDTIVDWDGYLVFTGSGGVWSVTGGGLAPGIHPIVHNALEMHDYFSARAFSATVPPGIGGDYTVHAAVLPAGTEASIERARGAYSQYDAVDFAVRD